METISINLAHKPAKKSLNGREYLVVPGTIIVPGVLPGSKGRLLYRPGEIQKSVDLWNHVPLVAPHPVINNVPVSARNPDILNTYGIGFVFNTEFTDKLKTELWFDVERTKAISPSLFNKVKNGKQIELSTGLFNKTKKVESGLTYNGKPYDYEAVDYKPDHVAILENDRGACSLEDGCGVNVNSSTNTDAQSIWAKLGELLGISKADDVVPTTEVVDEITDNQLSFSEIHNNLSKALRETRTQADPYCYIMDIYDDHFLFEMGGMVYSQKYKATDTGVELSTKPPVQVVRQVEYIPVTNTEINMPLNANQRKSIIDALTMNCDCWKGQGDAQVLNSFTDEKLIILKTAFDKSRQDSLVANMVQQKTGTITFNTAEELEAAFKKAMGVEERTTPDPILQPSSVVTIPIAQPVTQAMSVEEYINSAPVPVQNALKNLLANEERERINLVTQLTANIADDNQRKVAAGIYGAMPVDGLRQLVAVTPTSRFVGDPVLDRLSAEPINYAGISGPVVNSKENLDDDNLIPPTVNWAEEMKNRQVVRNRRG